MSEGYDARLTVHAVEMLSVTPNGQRVWNPLKSLFNLCLGGPKAYGPCLYRGTHHIPSCLHGAYVWKPEPSCSSKPKLEALTLQQKAVWQLRGSRKTYGAHGCFLGGFTAVLHQRLGHCIGLQKPILYVSGH